MVFHEAILFAAAFLYEHREEADYAGLLKRLRWLLFGVRRSCVGYRCWASIEPARGKVFYEMERKADTEYSKITIRWRPGVTHDMKVKYQDHLYDIDTIVDPYMRHEALELYCTEEVRGTDNERK